MSDLCNRKGRFLVANDLLRRHPEDLAPMFRDLIVVAVRHKPFEDALEYMAYGPQFPALIEGSIVPRYVCRVTQFEDEVCGRGIRVEWS